jgi:hypothetical protein
VALVLGVYAYSLGLARKLNRFIPYPERAAYPLIGAFLVELTPRSWRRDFWADVGLRLVAVGSIAWSVLILLSGMS